MACQICGYDVNVEYRKRSGFFLCKGCHHDTPRKVDRETFERIYWEGHADTVPQGIRDEFWSDYRMSRYGAVKDYQDRTRIAYA